MAYGLSTTAYGLSTMAHGPWTQQRQTATSQLGACVIVLHVQAFSGFPRRGYAGAPQPAACHLWARSGGMRRVGDSYVHSAADDAVAVGVADSTTATCRRDARGADQLQADHGRAPE